MLSSGKRKAASRNAILLMAGPGKDGKEGEFAELARAAGYNVVDVIRQRRTIDSRFYVGSGKLMQVKQLMADRGVTHVITYDKLKPASSITCAGS